MINSDRAWAGAFVATMAVTAIAVASVKLSWETPLPMAVIFPIIMIAIIAIHNIAHRA